MKSSQSKTLSIKKKRIRKLPKLLSDPKLKKRLLQHWQEIPVIKEIPEFMPALVEQEVRSAILNLLREGIEEYNEEQDLIEMRHVFSAKELRKLINERISKRIKISNVYFHINTLKDNGYLQIVTSIKEGRQITHFYGRTARLFLWIGEPLEKAKITEDSIYLNLKVLLKQFHPDLASEDIKELYRSFLQIKQETHDRVKLWMEKNVEILTKLNVDTREVYSFLKSIDQCNSHTIEIYHRIMKFINFHDE
ncbi:MAG: hypothetical protein ACFFB5_10175 [Promethearchaeota archaeon]